jgi:hypothetical protein
MRQSSSAPVRPTQRENPRGHSQKSLSGIRAAEMTTPTIATTESRSRILGSEPLGGSRTGGAHTAYSKVFTGRQLG